MGVWILVLLCLRRCNALSDPPSTGAIFRRNGARAVVLGDNVYIDGGYISGPEIPESFQKWKPVNDTFAIDVSRSWDPRDVIFLKSGGVLKKQNTFRNGLVVDENTQAVYLWGGRQEVQVSNRILWKFVPDGKGNGTWSPEVTTGIDGLVCTESSAHIAAHGLGFWFGGSVNFQTDYTSNAKVAGTEVPGFGVYNFTAKTWTYHTEMPEAMRTLYAATATYIPTFGPNGIIVLLGGKPGPLYSYAFDFGTIRFMDPVTMTWYAQTATGPLPPRRADHCALGVQGDNNTYEIFIYGGESSRDTSDSPTLGDVWVLSIPGFVWHQADGAVIDRRMRHACVRVGKRQMLSIGGVNTTDLGTMMMIPDPLQQSLGIFDMTEVKWTDKYDVDAQAYGTPEVIKKWYTDGGTSSVNWGVGVQALFQNKTSPQPNQSSIPTIQPPARGLSTGAIAGIAIGTFIGLVTIGVAVFLLFRKYYRKEIKEGQEPETRFCKQDSSSSALNSLPAPPEPVEMYSNHPELGGDTQRTALRDSLLVPGQIPTDRPVELHASGRLEMAG